ncbi:MAG TPA: LLM class F420-dependent oxidoreductase [Candidatus Acidoferrales bacterium]|nr:LLM class F420-dependent oxidoreductase [Candidatus Acidoferrales bacterium]
MKLGVVFPQTEIGNDAGAVREYAQAAESLGYDHIVAYDHVLGANSASRPGWNPPYTHRDAFYEPFVLFGYIAGFTKKIGLVTGVIILPQRQTALVAKQAAVLDVLSGGRLRLGVGIGWNFVEYEALGENFKNRGQRSEEQVAVLRCLWTQELVTFHGRWHQITDAGINPLPLQRPIPIWFGGGADPVLRRIARLGDGWFPQLEPNERYRAMFEKLSEYARQAGRDPAAIGVEARVSLRHQTLERCAEQARQWQDLGATHLSINTMSAGLPNVEAHLNAIRKFKEAARDLS